MNGIPIPWKKISMIAGTIGAMLGVMVAWEKLEFLPRWAWHTEVAAVQEFASGTRLLVLGQEWERLDQQIDRLERRQQPNDEERQLLSKLRRRMTEVEFQLDQLRK